MKKPTKTQILAAVAVTVGLATAGTAAVHAASTGSTGRMSNLVNAIAQKFNLKTSDVQQVVDQTEAQEQAQRQAQFEQNFQTKITQAVTSGQLTQDQANKILAKEQEVKTFMSSLQGKTQSEKNAAIQTEITSLKQWATDNGIPAQFQQFGMLGKGFGHGPMGMMGMRPIAKGTVAAVSGNTITITDNNTTYTVDASNAKIEKMTQPNSGSITPPQPTTITVSQIAVGDTLMVQGTVSGTNVTATQIVDGQFMGGRGMHRGFDGDNDDGQQPSSNSSTQQ